MTETHCIRCKSPPSPSPLRTGYLLTGGRRNDILTAGMWPQRASLFQRYCLVFSRHRRTSSN